MEGVPEMTAVSTEARTERFLVEYIDPSTGCIAADAVLWTSSLADLCKIVDPGATNIEPGCTYDLDADDLEKIGHEPTISFEMRSGSPSDAARLRAWLPIDDLPYRVHTNRELLLMLEGRKPLAVFSESHPNDTGYEFIPERHFAPHVASKILVKRELIEANAVGRTTRFVFYARPAEEWRIEAYILLLQTAKRTGWNEGFERMEGSLLGYEGWQNDAYIENVYRQNLAR